MTSPIDFSSLLQAADNGDREAADRLYLLVRNQLKRIARRRKAALNNGIDLSTNALVHDAFFQVVGQNLRDWQQQSREQFFSFVAVKIQDILIDAARAQSAQKRGQSHRRSEEDVSEIGLADAESWNAVELLLDLEEALNQFQAFAPGDANLFRLRYFLGCTFEELAEIVGLSPSSAKRGFARACAWLQRALRGYRQH